MRSCGTSGITTRFQELFRCMRQVGHALLTRSPLSPRQQAARDPVRLACVKHAASVHPEPESNPPQKNLHGDIQSDDSQQEKRRTILVRPRTVTQKTPTPIKPPRVPHGRASDWQSRTTTTPNSAIMASSTVHTIEFSNHQTHPQPRPGRTGPDRERQQEKNLHHNPHQHNPPACRNPQNPTTTMLPPACHKQMRASRFNHRRRAEQHRHTRCAGFIQSFLSIGSICSSYAVSA